MYYLSDNLWALKRSEECLGENPKGFPTQRVALEEEGQLRWVGGFRHTHRFSFFAMRLLGPCLACDADCCLYARECGVIRFPSLLVSSDTWFGLTNRAIMSQSSRIQTALGVEGG